MPTEPSSHELIDRFIWAFDHLVAIHSADGVEVSQASMCASLNRLAGRKVFSPSKISKRRVHDRGARGPSTIETNMLCRAGFAETLFRDPRVSMTDVPRYHSGERITIVKSAPKKTAHDTEHENLRAQLAAANEKLDEIILALKLKKSHSSATDHSTVVEITARKRGGR